MKEEQLLPGELAREVTPRLRRYGRRQAARRLRGLAASLDLLADPGPGWDQEVLSGTERAALRKRSAGLKAMATRLERA